MQRMVNGELVDLTPAEVAEIESAPVLPEPVPSEVADWQFAGQAAVEGIITQQEALDWAGSGKVPQVLWTAVDGAIKDPDQHFQVSMLLVGAKSYLRANPLVPLLGAVLNKDAAGLDQFWRDANKRGV